MRKSSDLPTLNSTTWRKTPQSPLWLYFYGTKWNGTCSWSCQSIWDVILRDVIRPVETVSECICNGAFILLTEVMNIALFLLKWNSCNWLNPRQPERLKHSARTTQTAGAREKAPQPQLTFPGLQYSAQLHCSPGPAANSTSSCS